ncbi:MAG: urea carboxylase [Firmicutes bacterium]|nr:urea carboxylase [Bacillota bacterium]
MRIHAGDLAEGHHSEVEPNQAPSPFAKVLVANRGAIAVRIIRTLHRMGITTVAVYTDADQDSLHVTAADFSVRIGTGPAASSYLDAELIIETAVRAGADAVHPGYGFLSESAGFARACRDRGLVFIGPDPDQIERFGQKHIARQIAATVGVPLLPGTGLLQGLPHAREQAAALGYPVILKSTAGGGGIGMRVCQDEAALCANYEAVRHLAMANFSDEGLYLERYISRARHIEVQVFGNRFGEVIALGERDCSVQRRNQKVVEETPAPGLAATVRDALLDSAVRLARVVGYRSAGTVEYLFDPEDGAFYFLEVNTRLQVEHGVTEAVWGIDLVEWMVREAADDLRDMGSMVAGPRGHSIQARLYAEDCWRDFAPSAGRVTQVEWPAQVRVETWIGDGTDVSTFYDPLLAKVIVHGEDRVEAVDKLSRALQTARIYGIVSNLRFLLAIVADPIFQQGDTYTRFLQDFSPVQRAIEVIDGGLQTTVQDYPGRLGFWDVGIPPSGPVDAWSFRAGNRLVGNADGTAGLELTMRGGAYRFRDSLRFCITGADMSATLDGERVALGTPQRARRGQVLRFGEARVGMRAYLLVEGGLDVPAIMGSGSTFVMGGFGGLGGRALRSGDVLEVGDATPTEPRPRQPLIMPPEMMPEMTHDWVIGVVAGPHSTEEFLLPDYLQQLTTSRFQVHHNSSRTGVRLMGPIPLWSRQDGGDAGLHPSNLHDNPYAIGALNLTGDMPILLGPDGPSLGGFVCPVTTATSELWKLGQLRPGDTVQFRLLTLAEAQAARIAQERCLTETPSGISVMREPARATETEPLSSVTQGRATSVYSPILARELLDRRFLLTVRCCGDANLLVEYGDLEFDLLLRFQVHALMDALQNCGDLPIIDLTPGIRSLQIHVDPLRISLQALCQRVLDLDRHLPPLETLRVPSRIVRLPMSWNDPSTQLAVTRYQETVRANAPWCPSNIEFIRRINGLATVEDVERTVLDATYLVLGLGDVYLGAPAAIPIDPRHRLVTTKYNPARTWTAEGTVGIGGSYLCIYGLEGPGGYQLIGRTLPIWSQVRAPRQFTQGKPWLLRFFDQIQFYRVTPEELVAMRMDFARGRCDIRIEETTFDLGPYLSAYGTMDAEAALNRRRQQDAFVAERERWKASGLAEFSSEQDVTAAAEEAEVQPGDWAVRGSMPGTVWKVHVAVGSQVVQDEPILTLESMKMEYPLVAPCSGALLSLHVRLGEHLKPDQLVATIRPSLDMEVATR